MTYPKTKEEWWTNLEKDWDNILSIISDQLDIKHPAYDTPGDPESALVGHNILKELQILKTNRDHKIARYLHATWHTATENYAADRHPGWGTLCDLLSEDYVLYEDEEVG